MTIKQKLYEKNISDQINKNNKFDKYINIYKI